MQCRPVMSHVKGCHRLRFIASWAKLGPQKAVPSPDGFFFAACQKKIQSRLGALTAGPDGFFFRSPAGRGRDWIFFSRPRPGRGRDWIFFSHSGVVTGFFFRGRAKFPSGWQDFWIPNKKSSHDPTKNPVTPGALLATIPAGMDRDGEDARRREGGARRIRQERGAVDRRGQPPHWEHAASFTEI